MTDSTDSLNICQNTSPQLSNTSAQLSTITTEESIEMPTKIAKLTTTTYSVLSQKKTFLDVHMSPNPYWEFEFSTEAISLTTALEHSPALPSLCVFLGSTKEVNRFICVSRKCRALFQEGRASVRDYVNAQIASEVFQIPFKLDAEKSLRRWEDYHVCWKSIYGSGSPYWLVRGADGNSVGRYLDKKVFAFGGSSVSGDNYSRSLYELSWNSDDSVTHKEVDCVVDSSFPSRAACGFVQTNNNMCYVFGGRSGTHYLDDLWSFKVKDTVVWMPHVTDAAQPAPRWAHSMIAIRESGFLLYGGSAPGRLFGDLWYFNGHTWQEVKQGENRPHERAGHSVAMISVGEIDWLYIFGGNTAGPIVETYSDLWRIPLICDNQRCRVVAEWENVNVAGTPLTPRIGHSLTLCGKRLVIFGGRNLSAASLDEQFAAVMDVIDVDFDTGAACNTAVPVPQDVRRTGHFVLSHPKGLVFVAGLSAQRSISSSILCVLV